MQLLLLQRFSKDHHKQIEKTRNLGIVKKIPILRVYAKSFLSSKLQVYQNDSGGRVVHTW